MERTKCTSIFQDLVCFLSKWGWVILAVYLVVNGCLYIIEAINLKDSGEVLLAIYSQVSGRGDFLAGMLLLVIDLLLNPSPNSSSNSSEK